VAPLALVQHVLKFDFPAMLSLDRLQARITSTKSRPDIYMGEGGCAPALGARYFIVTIPFPACISIVSNKLGNLLLVHS
jgi:hypothetical protein